MIGKKVTMELKRITKTVDPAGGWTETETNLRYITGVLSNIRGAERLSADKLTVISSHYFYIDFPVGISITAKDIFQYGTRKFEIIYPSNIGANQNKRLRITLKEDV